MTISDVEQDPLREILEALIRNDNTWLSAQAITISHEGGFWVLNYLKQPSTHDSRLVRGMVV
ncbi:MAG: hypothetical protein KDB01_13030 [Planctomycetaceae bacterium]|nr:hypothetical protein [Planctomycetaceae bacterium]